MFHYLKDRFAEYGISAMKMPDIKSISQEQSKEDKYVDYEITYHGTDVVVDCFSMTKKEIARNFTQALIDNLSEVLEVNAGNIRILTGGTDIVLCEITYTGKPKDFITHEIKRITTRPNEPHLVDEAIYNDLDESIPPPSEDVFNPYVDGFWGDDNWYCVRCGFTLMPIAPQHDTWGKFAWDIMREHKTQWYLCTNDECTHANTPLILHHAINGWTKPAAKAYSLSCVK